MLLQTAAAVAVTTADREYFLTRRQFAGVFPLALANSQALLDAHTPTVALRSSLLR